MRLTSSVILTFFLSLCFLIAGCSDGETTSAVNTSNSSEPLAEEDQTSTLVLDPTLTPSATAPPSSVISRVTALDYTAQFIEDIAPEPIGGVILESTVESDQPVTIVNGGSVEVGLISDTAFDSVYVSVDDQGHFQLQLPEAVLALPLVLSRSTTAEFGESVEVSIQVVTPGAEISDPFILQLDSIMVGTGEVQVSVSWDSPSDVDLYLIEPSGREISYLNGLSPTGGMLDLDSNPDCDIDGFNTENLTYEDGQPEVGEYIVGVRYYADCGVSRITNFVLTVRANGTIETFSGQLTPADVGTDTPFEIRFEVQPPTD